jgi:hypothetical protein
MNHRPVRRQHRINYQDDGRVPQRPHSDGLNGRKQASSHAENATRRETLVISVISPPPPPLAAAVVRIHLLQPPLHYLARLLRIKHHRPTLARREDLHASMQREEKR